jgi:hypothetical protein
MMAWATPYRASAPGLVEDKWLPALKEKFCASLMRILVLMAHTRDE